MVLDIIMRLCAFVALASATHAAPCCKSCTLPETKYYGVDLERRICRETCMTSADYDEYSPELTSANVPHPCSTIARYPTYYNSTVEEVRVMGADHPNLTITLDQYMVGRIDADVALADEGRKVPVPGLLRGAAPSSCKPVTVQENFDQKNFVEGGTWYIHQQMAISYLPLDRNFCVTADYTFNSKTELKVHNYCNIDKVNGQAEDSDVKVGALGGICGEVTDAATPAKLLVGPCRLRLLKKFAFGPYWILAAGGGTKGTPGNKYEWALISGGQPTIATKDGYCKTGDGTNGSGLWIFTRSGTRDEAVIEKVRSIAQGKGFDIDVLNDVDHKGCTYTPEKK